VSTYCLSLCGGQRQIACLCDLCVQLSGLANPSKKLVGNNVSSKKNLVGQLFLLEAKGAQPSLCGAHVYHFCHQIIGGYAAFLYEIGLLDEQQQKYFQKQCSKCVKYIKEQEWMKAFEVSAGGPQDALEQLKPSEERRGQEAHHGAPAFGMVSIPSSVYDQEAKE
jgi:hypothetical protein